MSEPRKTADTPVPHGAVRPLSVEDLGRVTEIDRSITGRSRRGFYEKRLAAMRKHPADLIGIGFVDGGRLTGFVLAHVLDGEFGGRQPVAMLDAIGVAPGARHRGAAHGLLAALQTRLVARGARELRTEAPWSEPGLLGLFAAADFALAPRFILERPTSGGTPI